MADPPPGWERRIDELTEEIAALRAQLGAQKGRPARKLDAALTALAPGRNDGSADDVDEHEEEPQGPTQDDANAPQQVAGMWSECPLAPPDAIFGLANKYKQDPDPKKVDLVVGAYRTDEGKPYLLPSVALAEERLVDLRLEKSYGPIDGLRDFCRASAELVLGQDSPALRENRIALCQTLSGTGALAIAANFYAQFLPIRTRVLLSRPTWANHRQIFDFFGFRNVGEYRYWDPDRKGLNFDGMIEDLRAAPRRSIVVLHLCAHNPTGCDPTLDQWRDIGRVLWDRRHHVVFDSAYQGYASGDLDRDAWPARLFEQEIGLEFSLTQSYSKNMGLYGERIGCFSYVCRTAAAAERIQTQIRSIVRVLYSNPPIHGARIVTMLLTDADLREQWGRELLGMSQRIIQMRSQLRSDLERLTGGRWEHITSQIGMFSFTGLTKEQVDHVVKKYHVYMLPSGRMSMAGLTTKNCEYVAAAIADALKAHPAPVQLKPAAAAAPAAKAPVSLSTPLDALRLPSPLGMWTQLPSAAADAIWGVQEAYLRDSDPRKLNLALSTGGASLQVALKDNTSAGGRGHGGPTGHGLLLPSVAEAERRLAERRLQKEYAPIDGDQEFCKVAARLVLGENSPALQHGRIALCQTISGTGALSMVASFYSRFLPIQTLVCFSSPTWHNHVDIFQNMGFRNHTRYRYWSPRNQGLDFDGMMEDLRAAPRRSIVVLQLCAHNPTGVDPTKQQWRAIGRLCRDRRHHVVIDNAYQGYATGNLDEDAFPARMFEQELGLEFAITLSFSKPMGLYGERIGCFMYVCKQQESAARITSQAKVIARRLYSNPPLHGARIVTTVLGDTELLNMWREEVTDSQQRFRRLRGALRSELAFLGTPGPRGGAGGRAWSHIEGQCGMFAYTGLTRQQLNHLRAESHVYLTSDGRLSVLGLTSRNAEQVAIAFNDAVRKHPFPDASASFSRRITNQPGGAAKEGISSLLLEGAGRRKGSKL